MMLDHHAYWLIDGYIPDGYFMVGGFMVVDDGEPLSRESWCMIANKAAANGGYANQQSSSNH